MLLPDGGGDRVYHLHVTSHKMRCFITTKLAVILGTRGCASCLALITMMTRHRAVTVACRQELA